MSQIIWDGQNSTWDGVSTFWGEAPPVAPTGTITVVSTTETTDTITVDFTYSESDVTSFEYRVESGPWVSIPVSPTSFEITGLEPSTSYLIAIRGVNDFGNSTAVSFLATTEAGIDTLSPSDILTGIPSLSQPTLFEIAPGVDALFPSDILTGIPVLSRPVLPPPGAMIPIGVLTGQPLLASPILEEIAELGIPQNVTVTVTSSTTAIVTWDEVAGAEVYQVEARVRAGVND